MFYLTIFALSFVLVFLALLTNRFPWAESDKNQSILFSIFVFSIVLVSGVVGWHSVEWVTTYFGFEFESDAVTRIAQVTNTIAILFTVFRGYLVWGTLGLTLSVLFWFGKFIAWVFGFQFGLATFGIYLAW